MSNICVLIASGLNVQLPELEYKIMTKVNQFGWGVFFNDYDLFPSHKKSNSFICSFSDDYRFDNCEMLLLPDGCWINGEKTNMVPFFDRMILLGSIIESTINSCDIVELFVGDSGEYMIEEFRPYEVIIQDFAYFMNRHFNSAFHPPAMHLLFKKPVGQRPLLCPKVTSTNNGPGDNGPGDGSVSQSDGQSDKK